MLRGALLLHMSIPSLPTFQGAVLCHTAECPAQVRVPLYLPRARGLALRVQERRLSGAPQLHGGGCPVVGSHRRYRETVLCQLNGRLQHLQQQMEVTYAELCDTSGSSQGRKSSLPSDIRMGVGRLIFS